ncbi:OapA family protein [Vibrio mangrovi]|uniref:LysM-like peptidoglycan-binding domain-containing protein n=1 Tax=Vibrio mangrovi TaxID=474394 RepID=A0A1Y6J1V7_9VIBR|nr:LysM-like peptidoglycan-binding domain-containing protein [Vibrio mangrovi]MDW6002812.1 LysM-like peptidoglycan-binding domain-containing protein [Vibrio mangrovi]SMS02303.1 putative peptidase [Vibrio mangrovi]
MNRRQEKKVQGGYLAVIQSKWSAINFQQSFQQVVRQCRRVWCELPKLHQRLLMILAPVVILLVLIPWPKEEQIASELPVGDQRVALDLDPNSLQEPSAPVASPKPASEPRTTTWVTYTVQNGDTLSKVFRANDLSLADLNALVQVEGLDKPLSNIKPGQLIRYKLTTKGQLDILQLEQKDQSVMFFRLSSGGFGRSK